MRRLISFAQSANQKNYQTLPPANVRFAAHLLDAHLRESIMRKLIALAVAGTGAAVGAAYIRRSDEFASLADRAVAAAERLLVGVEANPGPVLVALVTFLVTIVYHKARGKSLRESVEVAATRVQVVAVPAPLPADSLNSVVERARARATRTQLIADQIGLENRLRKLPEEIRKAELDACYTEQAVTEAEAALTRAEESLEAKLTANQTSAAKLEALRKELAGGETEMAAIGAELKKLADAV